MSLQRAKPSPHIVSRLSNQKETSMKDAIAERKAIKGAWGITALLFFFMMVNFADKAIVGLAGAQIMADLDLSPKQFGLLGSSFFLLFSVSAVLTGFLVNRVKSKWVLLIMGLVWALVQFPMLGAVGFETLIACRIILGAAEGPAYPVALHATYKWFPDERRAVPGAIIAQGAGAGVILTVPLLNWIITNYNWHYAFGALGLAGLVWTIVWALVGQEGPLGDEKAVDAKVNVDLVSYRSLLLNPTNLASWCAYFAAYFGLALVLSWFTPYLVKALGFSQDAAGKLTALLFLTGFFVVMLGSWLSEYIMKRGHGSRWARGVLAGVALCLGGLALVATPYASGATLKIALVIAGTTLPSIVYTLSPAILAEITPSSRRGAILAINSAIGTSAGIVAPYIMGSAVESAVSVADGYHHGFFVCGIVALVGGLIAIAFLKPRTEIAVSTAGASALAR